MEALAYTHLYTSYEDATEGDRNPIEIPGSCPSSPWLNLLAVLVWVGSMSTTQSAIAALYVNTPGGGCLNARHRPGGEVYRCVANGRQLAAPVARSGQWIQLATGPWVYGPYTRSTPVNPQGVGGTVVLRIGSEGPLVSRIQQKLQAAGYGSTLGAVDGAFGRRTQAAVIRYQRDRDLVADGVVGPRTLKQMDFIP